MSKQEQIYHSPVFKQFINKKKKFVLLLTSFFCIYYFSLPILTSFFPELISTNIFRGVTFVWIFALSQIFMTWTICQTYSFRAKLFDKTAQEIIKTYED